MLNLLTRALASAVEAPRVLVGTCAAVCLDTGRMPEGHPAAALRRWNVAPHECESASAPVHALPFVGLDELITKEETRT